MSDHQLLQRLLAGEDAAYRELVQRYQGAMRAVVFVIVGSDRPMSWCSLRVRAVQQS